MLSEELFEEVASILNDLPGDGVRCQTWDASTDGAPQGTAAAESVIFDQGSATIALPPLDAVVVTFD